MDADRELLERFVDGGSDGAFTDLVLRHAPSIQATCRRRLGDAAEADDAAQAVFLILARRAASWSASRQHQPA